MFPEYQRIMFATMLALSAVVAHVLSAIIPARLAVIVAYLAGILWTRRNDKVSQQFKTDIERVLQPNKKMLITVLGCTIFGLLTASALAGVVSPAIAAPFGLMATFAIVKKLHE